MALVGRSFLGLPPGCTFTEVGTGESFTLTPGRMVPPGVVQSGPGFSCQQHSARPGMGRSGSRQGGTVEGSRKTKMFWEKEHNAAGKAQSDTF